MSVKTQKFLDLPDFGKNQSREIRAEYIKAVAIWLDMDGMSHNAVLQQVVEKLVEAGWASEQEIKEVWLDLLKAELESSNAN